MTVFPYRSVLWVIALGLSLAHTPAKAGIYFTSESPALPLPTEFRAITFMLLDLRSIAADKVNEDTPVRSRYRKLLANLESKEAQGMLLLEDRIDLGACYLRLLRYRDAKRVLEEAERICPRESPYRFLMLANLAVTFQGLAETEQQATYYDQAIAYQRQCLTAWPELYPGWFLWQGQSFRRAELFYLRMLEVRRREVAQLGGPRAFQWQQYDDLFEGVQFIGLEDEYEAGRVAPTYWDKLPVDAPQLVLQLLYWFPYDDRLYWLYGEVLNTRNQIVEAYLVFDDLVGKRKLRYRTLMRHHRTLEEPARARRALDEQLSRDPTTLMQVLMACSPRGATLAWGAGAGCLEAVWLVVFEVLTASETSTNGDSGAPPSGRIPFAWQPVFVGFGAGTLVGVLLVLQIQQWRRRLGDSVNDRRIKAG